MSKRTITIEDLTDIQFVGTPQRSPLNEEVVYTVTKMNLEQNGYESSLWLSSIDSQPVQLTTYAQKDKLIKDHRPVWHPEGNKIYFLSNRTEKQQVWCIPLTGGEAKLVTEFEEGVSGFQLSPDGTKLICQIEVKDENPVEKENEDVVIVERLRYLGNG